MNNKGIKQTEEYKFVNEYMRPLWERVNPNRDILITETTRRLMWFLKENPEYNLTHIKKAIHYYISNTNPTYVRAMHYFIWKDHRTNSLLGSILERISTAKKDSKSVTRKMQ